MMEVRLSDEELASVVQRAHEISSLHERLGEAPRSLDEYVKVAEEMGVPREAMMQALIERFAFLDKEIEAGLLVFARSEDGRSYPAKVLSSDGDSVKVRFLNGSESRVGRQALQDASFTPGATYEYYSPSMAMFTKSQVSRFDSDAQTVTFSKWGTEETVPLAKVRTARPRPQGASNMGSAIYLVVAGAGGLIGALATWLVMR